MVEWLHQQNRRNLSKSKWIFFFSSLLQLLQNIFVFYSFSFCQRQMPLVRYCIRCISCTERNEMSECCAWKQQMDKCTSVNGSAISINRNYSVHSCTSPWHQPIRLVRFISAQHRAHSKCSCSWSEAKNILVAERISWQPNNNGKKCFSFGCFRIINPFATTFHPRASVRITNNSPDCIPAIFHVEFPSIMMMRNRTLRPTRSRVWSDAGLNAHSMERQWKILQFDIKEWKICAITIVAAAAIVAATNECDRCEYSIAVQRQSKPKHFPGKHEM